MKWMTELERKPATIIFKLHYTEYSSILHWVGVRHSEGPPFRNGAIARGSHSRSPTNTYIL